jgi:hypothetical protein
MHFVHHRSSVKGAIPLLLVHGWPGSFVEFLELIPMLVDGDGDGNGKRLSVAPPCSPPHFSSTSLPRVTPK